MFEEKVSFMIMSVKGYASLYKIKSFDTISSVISIEPSAEVSIFTVETGSFLKGCVLKFSVK